MIGRIITRLHQIEDLLLIVMVMVMILVAALQILLRNLFDAGLMWGDPLVRVLVLWIGLLGAMAASRTDSHIKIDIMVRYLPKKARRIIETVIQLLTALICLFMAWFGKNLVLMEMAFSLSAFGSIPVWVCEMIIPIAFAVMGMRYLLMAVQSLHVQAGQRS